MNNIKNHIECMSSRVALHTSRTKTCNPEVVDGHLLNHCYDMVEHLLFLLYASWHAIYQEKFALNYDDKS
jgi:hypothetical protein